MWTYDDIYKALITFINQDLTDTDYTLNFGMITLSTHSNQALLKFKLLNVQISHSTRQICVIMGDTIEELTEEVQVFVHLKKGELSTTV